MVLHISLEIGASQAASIWKWENDANILSLLLWIYLLSDSRMIHEIVSEDCPQVLFPAKMAINLNMICVLVIDMVKGNMNGISVVCFERNWGRNLDSQFLEQFCKPYDFLNTQKTWHDILPYWRILKLYLVSCISKGWYMPKNRHCQSRWTSGVWDPTQLTFA